MRQTFLEELLSLKHICREVCYISKIINCFRANRISLNLAKTQKSWTFKEVGKKATNKSTNKIFRSSIRWASLIQKANWQSWKKKLMGQQVFLSNLDLVYPYRSWTLYIMQYLTLIWDISVKFRICKQN